MITDPRPGMIVTCEGSTASIDINHEDKDFYYWRGVPDWPDEQIAKCEAILGNIGNTGKPTSAEVDVDGRRGVVIEHKQCGIYALVKFETGTEVLISSKSLTEVPSLKLLAEAADDVLA